MAVIVRIIVRKIKKPGFSRLCLFFDLLRETALRLRIAPEDFRPALPFLRGSGSQQTAETCPPRSRTDDINLEPIPSGIFKRRINRVVIARQQNSAVVGEQRFDQFSVIAIPELVLVASSLARARNVGRIAICQPPGTAETRQHIPPVAALNLDTLHSIVNAREIVET